MGEGNFQFSIFFSLNAYFFSHLTLHEFFVPTPPSRFEWFVPYILLISKAMNGKGSSMLNETRVCAQISELVM